MLVIEKIYIFGPHSHAIVIIQKRTVLDSVNCACLMTSDEVRGSVDSVFLTGDNNTLHTGHCRRGTVNVCVYTQYTIHEGCHTMKLLFGSTTRWNYDMTTLVMVRISKKTKNNCVHIIIIVNTHKAEMNVELEIEIQQHSHSHSDEVEAGDFVRNECSEGGGQRKIKEGKQKR